MAQPLLLLSQGPPLLLKIQVLLQVSVVTLALASTLTTVDLHFPTMLPGQLSLVPRQALTL